MDSWKQTGDLLQLTSAGGCGCKLPLNEMREFMTGIDNLLGHRASSVRLDGTDRDDAALYEITPGLLLAVTVDFGTPISSDLATWGRISAQNALSDIFAMGARPLLALSVLALPQSLGVAAMTELTSAAVATLTEASTPLVGGHTVRSEVPLFGLCIVGQVSVENVMLLCNCEPGDLLILTKPLGTGIVIAAKKAGVVPAGMVQVAEEVMLASNRIAATLATDAGVRAATDVTGFGLVGHLHNMMAASKCSARISEGALPVIPGVRALLDQHGVVPNSAERNLFAVEDCVDWAQTPFSTRLVMTDPQTSGGLLLSVAEDRAAALLEACEKEGVPATIIGRVLDGLPGAIQVTD
ncbi:selenide, water dikinase SelD [Nonomuraea sp. NPDC048892]|uniref:selenide, water dikinase SelD n=1 Tax=Nonomuraea sp. NPDC048892 TaxID=3154624 RepID=UPI0033DABD5A